MLLISSSTFVRSLFGLEKCALNFVFWNSLGLYSTIFELWLVVYSLGVALRLWML